MKKILFIAMLGISLLTGCNKPKPQDIQYTVDRIEIGQNGEQWAVVEVYNKDTDTITMIDIKVEEGYRVIK